MEQGKMTEKAIQNFLDKKVTYAGSNGPLPSHELILACLARCFEKIKKTDTVQSLYLRLKKKENKIYVESLIRLSQSYP